MRYRYIILAVISVCLPNFICLASPPGISNYNFAIGEPSKIQCEPCTKPYCKISDDFKNNFNLITLDAENNKSKINLTNIILNLSNETLERDCRYFLNISDGFEKNLNESSLNKSRVNYIIRRNGENIFKIYKIEGINVESVEGSVQVKSLESTNTFQNIFDSILIFTKVVHSSFIFVILPLLVISAYYISVTKKKKV